MFRRSSRRGPHWPPSTPIRTCRCSHHLPTAASSSRARLTTRATALTRQTEAYPAAAPTFGIRFERRVLTPAVPKQHRRPAGASLYGRGQLRHVPGADDQRRGTRQSEPTAGAYQHRFVGVGRSEDRPQAGQMRRRGRGSPLCSRHPDRLSHRVGAHRFTRPDAGEPNLMMLPSGSTRAPSCCPQSVSCGGCTSPPADRHSWAVSSASSTQM